MSTVFVACDKENSISSNQEHEYVTTVTQATCTQAGERVKRCAGCDFYEREQTPPLAIRMKTVINVVCVNIFQQSFLILGI